MAHQPEAAKPSEGAGSSLLTRYLQAVSEPPSDGDISSPLEQVSRLGCKHMSQFCFSSIGVLLKRPLPLDTDLILNKLVVGKQGGYCFEHNKLFYEVLEGLGMQVVPALARVLYNVSVDDPKSPKTHRITLLHAGSRRYVVDVGFGANGPKVPVEISDTPTVGPWGERYRIINNSRGDWLLQVFKNTEYFTLYSFDDGYYNDADFEMSHFYSHAHPSAGFVNNLVVAKSLKDRVISLKNNKLWIINRESVSETHVASSGQLASILNSHFGIFEAHTGIEYLFDRFCHGRE